MELHAVAFQLSWTSQAGLSVELTVETVSSESSHVHDLPTRTQQLIAASLCTCRVTCQLCTARVEPLPVAERWQASDRWLETQWRECAEDDWRCRRTPRRSAARLRPTMASAG